MKRMDLFCASPASTAICTGSDVRRSMIRHGGRPIDRHSPHRHHHHHLPRRTQPHIPCSSQLMPVIPRPYSDKTRPSSSKQISSDARRKSSADIYDLKSPAGSARFLLSDVAFSDLISEPTREGDDLSAIVPVGQPPVKVKPRHSVSSTLTDRDDNYAIVPVGQSTMKVKPRHSVSSTSTDHDDLSAIVPVGQPTVKVKPRHTVLSTESPSTLRSSQSTRARNQVVVLRVSLHCKGCESKLRKHLAKMEGVTSYSIDMETKKVTIRGDVTPLGVLSSVSRVKYAQLWPYSSSSLTSQSPSWSA